MKIAACVTLILAAVVRADRGELGLDVNPQGHFVGRHHAESRHFQTPRLHDYPRRDDGRFYGSQSNEQRKIPDEAEGAFVEERELPDEERGLQPGQPVNNDANDARMAQEGLTNEQQEWPDEKTSVNRDDESNQHDARTSDDGDSGTVPGERPKPEIVEHQDASNRHQQKKEQDSRLPSKAREAAKEETDAKGKSSKDIRKEDEDEDSSSSGASSSNEENEDVPENAWEWMSPVPGFDRAQRNALNLYASKGQGKSDPKQKAFAHKAGSKAQEKTSDQRAKPPPSDKAATGRDSNDRQNEHSENEHRLADNVVLND